jgi:hypothetical protein
MATDDLNNENAKSNRAPLRARDQRSGGVCRAGTLPRQLPMRSAARVLDIRERECVRTSFFAMSADEELLHLVAAPRQASTVSER